jgi:hypothetical protein
MALKKAVLFKGISIADAYIRVANPTIHAGNAFMSFGIHYSATSEDSPFDVASGECSYDLYGENPIAQAYEHLKTLSEFEGCIDC